MENLLRRFVPKGIVLEKKEMKEIDFGGPVGEEYW